MPVIFGSVDDILAVCTRVKDLVGTLDKSRGASTEYQPIIHEPWGLNRSLLYVSMLSKTCDDCMELTALRATAMQVVDNCRLNLIRFLEKN